MSRWLRTTVRPIDIRLDQIRPEQPQLVHATALRTAGMDRWQDGCRAQETLESACGSRAPARMSRRAGRSAGGNRACADSGAARRWRSPQPSRPCRRFRASTDCAKSGATGPRTAGRSRETGAAPHSGFADSKACVPSLEPLSKKTRTAAPTADSSPEEIRQDVRFVPADGVEVHNGPAPKEHGQPVGGDA